MASLTRDTWMQFWDNDRSLRALMVLLVLLLLFMGPLAETGAAGTIVIDLLLSFLLISGVGSVSQGRVQVVVVSAFAVAAFSANWLAAVVSSPWIDLSAALTLAVYCALMAAIVFARVFRDREVTLARIEGAVAAYILLGLMWAGFYETIMIFDPRAFSFAVAGPIEGRVLRARLTYFSFVTLTTVGYGDITALHSTARGLAMIEALIGQLYPAILIGGLVSMAVESRAGKGAPPK